MVNNKDFPLINKQYYFFIIISLITFILAFSNNTLIWRYFPEESIGFARLILLIFSLLCLIIPSVFFLRIHMAYEWKQIVNDLESKLIDVKSIQREYIFTANEIKELQQQSIEMKNNYGFAVNDIKTKISEVTHIIQSVNNLREKIQELNQAEDLWVKTYFDLLKVLNKDITNPILPEEYRKSLSDSFIHAQKLLSVNHIDFEVINPSSGDVFKDTLHKCIRKEKVDNKPIDCILACESIGYKYKGSTYEKALVVCSDGPLANDDNEITLDCTDNND